MSTTINDEVVKLSFDNSNFERNARTSMTTIEKLKASLNFDKSSQSFDNFSRTISASSFGNLERTLNSINHRFSLWGIAGATVISNLTKSAMHLGNVLVKNVTEPLLQGGKSRALNLAQARFMMDGLLHDAKKVEDVVGIAGNAVTDTAYSLDAAANTAAQFLASGLTDYDKLQKALSAVSGVAAMTNSRFEDIGQIFTTVSGNGRLMGDQLLQLSTRGLNAASVLAKAMGKTEEEVRKMTSKGEISFQQFYEAMFNAYGDQAKKSNETFTGSFANMKAAISRIGADFYDFLLKDATKIFNATKGKIKELHGNLGSFIQATKGAADTATRYILKVINAIDTSKISGFLDNTLGNVFRGISNNFMSKDMWVDFVNQSGDSAKLFKKEIKKTAKEYGINVNDMVKETGSFRKSLDKGWLTSDIIKDTLKRMKDLSKGNAEMEKSYKDLEKTANKVINGDFDNGAKRMEKLTKAGYDYGTVQNLVNKKLGSSVRHPEKMSDAMLKAAGYTEKEIKLLRELAKEAKETGTPLNDIIKSLDKQKTGGSMIFATLKNVLKPIRTIIEAIGKAFVNVFAPKSKGATGVREFITKIYELSKKLKISDETAQKITHAFTIVFSVIKKGIGFVISLIKFVVKLADSFGKFTKKLYENRDAHKKNTAATERNKTMLEGFLGILKGIAGIAKKVATVIVDIAKGIVDFVKKAAKLDGVQRLGNVIKDIVVGIIDKIKELGGLFGKVITPQVANMTSGLNADFFLTVIDNVANGIATFLENIKNAPDIISAFFGAIKDGASGFGDIFSGLFGGLGKKDIDLSGMDAVTTKITDFPTTIDNAKTNLETTLSGYVDTFKKRIENISPENIWKFIKGSAFVVIAAKIIKFFKSITDPVEGFKDIPKSIKNVLDKYAETLESTKRLNNANAFLKAAEAIGILAASILVLSFIPPDRLANTVVMLGFVIICTALLLAVVAAIMKVYAESKKVPTATETITDAFNKFIDRITAPISRFTDSLSRSIDKVAKGAFFVSLGIVIALIVWSLKSIQEIPDIGEAGLKLLTIVAFLGSFIVLLDKYVSEDFDAAGFGKFFSGLAFCVITLTAVTAILGMLPMDVLSNGLIALIGIMGTIAIFTAIVNQLKAAPGDMIKVSASLLILAIAIEALVLAITILGLLGKFSWGGILAILALVAGLGVLTSNFEGAKMLATAGALAALAGALNLLMIPVLIMGTMFETAASGILVLAGALMVLLLAGAFAESVAPGLVALTAALDGIGISVLAVGAGIALLSLGFYIAAQGVSVLGTALPILAQGLVAFADIVIANGPKIILAIGVIILGIVGAIAAAAAPIAAAVVGIIIAIIVTIADKMPEIINAIVTLVKAAGDAIFTLLTSDAPAKMASAFGMLWDTIVNFFTGYIIPGAKNLGQKIINAIIESLAQQSETLFGKNNFAAKWLRGLKKDVKEPSKDVGKEAGKGITDSTKETVEKDKQGIQDLFKGYATEGTKGFDLGINQWDPTKLLDDKTKGLGKQFDISETLNKNTNALKDMDVGNIKVGAADTSDLTKSLSDTKKSAKTSGTDAGNALISALSKVIKSAKGVKDAGASAARKGASGAKEARGSFVSAGNSLAAGLASGINSGSRGVETAVNHLAELANRAIRLKEKIKSPSRVWLAFGRFMAQGLINGLAAMETNVGRASSRFGAVAERGISKSLVSVSSLLNSNLDTNPTITPVLDASGVKRGISAINSQFGSQTLSFTAGVNANIASMMNAANSFQNGGNADVVSALSKLRNDINKVRPNVTNINGITYDDGSNITEAVGVLVNAAVVGGRA